MKKLRLYLNVLKKTAIAFSDDNAFKLSASLSYYTIFSLSPLLIIIISLAGIFFGRDAVQGKIYGEIRELVGSDAALQIQQIIQNLQHSKHNAIGALIGIIVLIFGATGVFTEIQGSINYIWSVKAKPQRGWANYLLNRLVSFSLVISLGFLLLVSLTVNALMDLLSQRLMHFLPSFTVQVFYIINILILFCVITLLFAIIFKVLPDATINWKDAFIGAAFTAILFMIGKFLIGYYLGSSNIGVTYGAAASIVILLLWIYYSSIILYFGAEFTRVYAISAGSGIKPTHKSVFIVKQEAHEVPPSYLET